MAIKKSVPYERAEQVAVVRNLTRKGFFVYHIPNHKKMDKVAGALEGMPDLQVVLKDRQVIWIEMKRRKGGKVSDEQKKAHKVLKDLGHIVILAKGAKEAVEQFNQVLESLGLLSPNESLVPSHRDHLEASDKGDNDRRRDNAED